MDMFETIMKISGNNELIAYEITTVIIGVVLTTLFFVSTYYVWLIFVMRGKTELESPWRCLFGWLRDGIGQIWKRI